MRFASLHCSVRPGQRAPALPSSAVAPASYLSTSCVEATRVRRRRAMQPGRVACDAAAGTCAAGANDSGKPCCAVSFAKATPPGDERQRDVCTTCGFVDYKNPKVVVAAVVVRGRSVLLCKRAIEPSAGKWGFPQGKHAAACAYRAPAHSPCAHLCARRLPRARRKRTSRRRTRSAGGGGRGRRAWPAAGSLRRARLRAARVPVAPAAVARHRSAT